MTYLFENKQKEIFLQKMKYFYQSIWSVMKNAVSLHPQCSDGGIGRRAGLKHQWGNSSRFDPGSEYNKPL
jgi:hypothetical protein